MFRKLNALLWLRLQVLISNSTLLATLLLPFGLAVLYNEFLNKSGELSTYFLSMSLTMVLSMGSGYMVSIMMAEDKEKRNLKSLILSGYFQYAHSPSVDYVAWNDFTTNLF